MKRHSFCFTVPCVMSKLDSSGGRSCSAHQSCREKYTQPLGARPFSVAVCPFSSPFRAVCQSCIHKPTYRSCSRHPKPNSQNSSLTSFNSLSIGAETYCRITDLCIFCEGDVKHSAKLMPPSGDDHKFPRQPRLPSCNPAITVHLCLPILGLTPDFSTSKVKRTPAEAWKRTLDTRFAGRYSTTRRA